MPDYAKAIAFLRKCHPGRRWVLTAIAPDRKTIETETFDANREAECLQWLQAQGSQRRNLYYSLGEVARDVTKKAERTDIARVWYLHTDLDPRAGEDVAQEQTRILALLRNPPSPLPPPTCIIFSGGGYQALWALKEPIAIDCDLAKAEDAKLYNLQIELLLGADNVRDVSRILRLPGTINIPDPLKLKKGRKAALAEVIEWHEDRVYEIGQFTKAPDVHSAGTGASSTGSPTSVQRVQVSGNVRRFNSVDEISGKLGPRAKVVIVQGFDPDEPNKFSGRSEWLFYACCEMVRGGCSDDEIYAVITDPQFGISASVLDKGSMIHRYAIRQIERAREEAINPWLRKLNDQFAVIGNWGGKCRIVEEQFDEAMGRYRLTKQTVEDFRHRHMHIQVQTGNNDRQQPIFKPLGDWWLRHDQRRQFEKLIFAPGREVPNAYNLWRGFACAAKPGDCRPFLQFLLDIICAGKRRHYRYLVRWLAHMAQKPGEPGCIAVVLKGLKGIGKSFMAEAVGSLLGRHYIQVTDAKHLTGHFNAHLRDCVLLFGDEAFYAGNRQHEATLKRLITERTLTIEGKGVDAETAANCLHIILASNSEWVVPASWDERRFFILKPSEARRNDSAYFRQLDQWLKNGGREALLHHLLTLDQKRFNVRDVPKTEGLREEQDTSKPESVQWIELLAEDGILPGNLGGKQAHIAYSNHPDRTIDGLYGDARRRIPELRNTSDKKLGRMLKAWGAKNWSDGGRRGWEFPSLQKLRLALEAKYGKRDWPGGRDAEWQDGREGF